MGIVPQHYVQTAEVRLPSRPPLDKRDYPSASLSEKADIVSVAME